jgi:CheY-like chemotaxis protein
VEAMGGCMGVQSTEGVGSRFWLDLNATTSPLLAVESAGSTVAPALVPGQARTRTVLYIEDNLSNLKLVQLLLSRWPGTTLLSAMQGQLGLDFARQYHPDLILLDIHLPDINGDQVLNRLRANAATWSIPVIVVSADATAGQIARLMEAGALAYLTKPIDVPQFLAVVGDALSGRGRESKDAA